MRLRDFWQRITGIQRALVQLFILSLALQLFALASPFYMQLVVDDALVSHDTNLLAVLALGFLLLTLIQIGTNALRSYVVMVLGNTLNIQMVSNLFRHLIRLPLSYFQSRHIGDVVSRFQSVSHVKDMFTTGMVEAFVDGLLVLSTLVLMFFYSPILGGIALAFAVLYLLVRWLTFHPFKRLTEETIVAKAKEQSNFMETVRGMQSVKLFNREVDRHTLWQNLYATVVNAGIRVAKFHIGFDTANKLLSGVENILVVYLGAKMVLDNTFTVGMLFAFMSYKRQFTDKTDGLVDKFIQFRMLELHFDRIADIAYRYTENDPYLFMNVNLQVKPGETQACLHHEIVAMPMGYNSLVGDMGTSLSGGQKQRILLARALYRQPKILFLDEATSHLDVQTERQVNAAIHQLDITRIIIAHRPETIRSANRVVALVNGQLQEVAPPIPA